MLTDDEVAAIQARCVEYCERDERSRRGVKLDILALLQTIAELREELAQARNAAANAH